MARDNATPCRLNSCLQGNSISKLVTVLVTVLVTIIVVPKSSSITLLRP